MPGPYHRGPTHSLLFALVVAYPMTQAHRVWSRIPRITYKTASFLILTHIFADILFTSSPVSFFWPLENKLAQPYPHRLGGDRQFVITFSNTGWKGNPGQSEPGGSDPLCKSLA